MTTLYNFIPLSDESADLNETLRQIADSLLSLDERVQGLEVSAWMDLRPPPELVDAVGLGAAWRIVDWYDAPITPNNMTFSNPNFGFLIPGIYSISVSISLRHNELNSGREFSARLVNVTTSDNILIYKIYTGRDQAGSTASVNAIVTIGEGVNDQYRIEVGNGSTYSNVIWDATEVVITYIGVIP